MLIKFANADLLEAKVAHRGDTLLRTAHRATFNYEPREGFLYVRSRAISSRTNDNFDTWPADELRQAWATFIGKPVFVNHHNKDHRRARGVIIDAVLHEDTSPDGTPDTWVEVLMEVDAVRFPKLAKAILAGDIERTSMGADVGESECSYCGNVATTPDTYCVHVSRHKGQRLLRKNADGTQEDVLVHEICIAQGEVVHTMRGLVPIESVVVGDMALTRAGWRRVTDARQTGVRPTVKIVLSDGTTLRCTEDHLIATAAGWTPAMSLLVVDVHADATVPVRTLAGVHVGVLGSELVPSLAVGLEGVPVVHSVGAGFDQPQMVGVDAVATPTDMVDFHSLDFVPEKTHHSSVDQSFVVRVAADAPVPIEGGASLPDEATIVLGGASEQSFQFVQAVCVIDDDTVPVYDLTVEGEHEFVVNGIVVHNCRKISFFENSVLVEPPADPTAFFLGVDDRGVRSLGMTANGKTVTAASSVKIVRDAPNEWSAIDDGYDVGFLKLRRDSGGWVIDEIHVDDGYRREGIATALLRTAESEVGPIAHSTPEDMTPEGMAWARSTGADVQGLPGSTWNPLTAKIKDDPYVELTEEQKERFAGTTVRQDDDGFYCHTHRARGKSYPSIDEIPDDEVGFIESTGAAASFETEVQQEMTKMANRKKDRWRTMAKAASVTKEGVTQEESERLLDGLDEKYRSALEKFVPYTVYGPTYSRGITTNLMDAIRAARQRNDASFNYFWSKCEAGYDIETMGGEDNWYYDSAMGQYTKRLATTAGALDYGPTEPGPRAGTRWEGIISTPNSRAYEVTVFWPGDEAPMLSGVFDSQERAREWAQKCVDAGGLNVLIENAGNFERFGSTKLAWGEMKAPAVVNTLGLVECPVCGERNKFDGTGRCTVCGFLPPPEPFREPDLEVAQKVDMRDGWVNPELMSAPAFVPPEEGDDEANPVQKDIVPNEGAERTGGIRMRPSEAIAQRQAQQIQALRAENARLRAAQGGRQRRADVNNPGQPVPEPAAQAASASTEETRSPDATADVTSGSAVLTDVGPATTTDVTSPGAAMTNVAPLANADVTAPVAGTTEMPPYADTVIKIEPDASGGTDTAPAFSGDSSWVQARKAAEAHVFASLRLARLRIRAGIESGDDLVIAEKIAATTRPEIVRTQIATLDQVVRSASVQQQRRPAPHVAQRSAPSLASMAVPGIQAVGGFAGLAVSQDEVGLFD